MMRNYALVARKYRLYAQELRVIAEDDDPEVNAIKLQSIADDYDAMAASMEAIADSREKLKRM